jgi:hypothetical protein
MVDGEKGVIGGGVASRFLFFEDLSKLILNLNFFFKTFPNFLIFLDFVQYYFEQA